MRRTHIRPSLLLLACLAAGAAPLPARADPPAPPEADGGGILPNEEELRELGDMAERMLRRFGERMEPMAERLRALVDDLDAYEAPEMLPNGDIIIRRKPDAPPPEPSDDDRDGIAL